ncbi:MAG: 23S rRNA (adenine(2030)-N(6))-methyltransferase RlmJ [Alphaproteobacteria bacterium]
MNYRHAYHAGNFADVLKHAVLALTVERLKRKGKPFVVIDTHAGAGSYDLAAAEAGRTGEAHHGILRVLDATDRPPALTPYIDCVRRINAADPTATAAAPRWYPGSPRLAVDLLRPGDRLVALELHPRDAETLAAEFAGDRRATIHARDGWTALKAFLPPKERRGVVLVDPPFEKPDEFGRLLRGLAEAHRRWATGVYLLWYPVKDRTEADAFAAALRALALPRTLLVELAVAGVRPDEKLSACGLALINPPWRMDMEIGGLLPWLVRTLARGPGAGHRMEWLVGEPAAGQIADPL